MIENKTVKINGIDINVLIKDNKRNTTILYVHGFNSSHDSGNLLFEKLTSFNIVAVDLPGSKYSPTDKQLSLELFALVLKKVLKKYIHSKKVILLGHSLGGASILNLQDNPKVIGNIFVATIHPKLADNFGQTVVELMRDDETMVKRLRKKVFKGAIKVAKIKISDDFLNTITEQNSPFSYIIQNNMLNNEWLQDKLKDQYKSLKKPSIFCVGDKDGIISTKGFTQFVNNELQRPLRTFEECGHNPMKDSTDEIINYIESSFSSKRKLFNKKSFKC